MKNILKKLSFLLFLFPALASCGGSTTDSIPSLTLSNERVRIEVYDEYLLTYTSNVEGEAVWTSSNEEVASVNDGLVYGLSAGVSTISVTLGELTASCTFTIESSDVAPVLVLEESNLTLAKGDKGYEVDLYVTYKEQVQSATFEFAFEGVNNLVNLTHSGTTLVIDTTDLVGTATITISTTVRGTLLLDRLLIEVVEL